MNTGEWTIQNDDNLDNLKKGEILRSSRISI